MAWDRGLNSEHFSTTVFPHSMATKMARSDRSIGEFHGAMANLQVQRAIGLGGLQMTELQVPANEHG